MTQCQEQHALEDEGREENQHQLNVAIIVQIENWIIMIILLTQNNSFIFICVHICEYTAPLCVKNASKFFFRDEKRER